jgi:glycosyltransferase involved in cell wall biosynthesis
MINKMISPDGFQKELIRELEIFNEIQSVRFPEEETLIIDLHCHDYNSDVPDEILGRILKVPETWLPTENLLKTLKRHGCTAYTVTNHNNARTIWEQHEKETDILSAAEFSCFVPDFQTGIHVLTYGFNQKQEKILNKLRQNLYAFQEYSNEHDIPTIWAHPLYNYSTKGIPPFEFYEKMALVFERFEVLNGQRDTWQNMLVKEWVKSLVPEKIDELKAKFGMDPSRFCRDIYKKSMSGGSDSHMGIFSGLTGTKLYVPGLKNKVPVISTSELALEAIRKGQMAPFGSFNNNEKMTVAFLDYVFQLALHYEDPGIVRLLLHKGSPGEKLTALAASNLFLELKRHKVTMNFVKLFHKSFAGKKPGFAKKILVPKVYRPIFNDAYKIADAKMKRPDKIIETFTSAVYDVSEKLDKILSERLARKIQKLNKKYEEASFNPVEIIEKLELPTELRALFGKSKKKEGNGEFSLSGFLDGLSFPFLTSALILSANFLSARVLFNNRPLLEQFSEKINHLKHPKRMLWLTDTFEDNNGVSMVLKAFHKEIVKRNLPIDFLVCSNSLNSDKNLIVLRPMLEFELPFYKHQPIKIPRMLDIQKLFTKGEYDRIICSTEGPMGWVALFLKNAYLVPAYFYMHTDWMMFARKTLKFDSDNLSRMRRILRTFYKNFDKHFVLNTDHKEWLTSIEMGIEEQKVNLTAHWAESEFHPRKSDKGVLFEIPFNKPVVLYAGRLSKEKGVMELPSICKKVKEEIPEIEFVIAGTGPAEEDLKLELPGAKYLGWVNHGDLPEIYSAADILILPSKFDTFSCSVIEALSCGLPVIAYNTKGPKDIILDGKTGFLVTNKKGLAEKIISFFKEKDLQETFKNLAEKRAKDYMPDKIINKFIHDCELEIPV